MKLTYFIFALFYLTSSLQAQNEFAPLGAKWTYSIVENLWFIQNPTTLEVIEVQTVNGKKMKKLHSEGYKGCAAFSEWIYEENGKIYQYVNQKSYLLYDFNAKAGDSWKIVFFTATSRTDSVLVKVDSISSLNTSSGTKKIQYVSRVKNVNWSTGDIGKYIIEGIGFNDYFFPNFGLCDASPYGIRCYSENGITTKLVPYDCNKTINWVSNEDLVSSISLSISPNPTVGNITIQISEIQSNLSTWQLFNLQGKKVFSQQLVNENTLADLPAFLPQGIYFWRIMDGAQKLGQGKLVLVR